MTPTPELIRLLGNGVVKRSAKKLSATKHASSVAEDNTDLRNMLVGAGLTSAAPVSSHLLYELKERPEYARQIKDLVDRASAENKIFAAPTRGPRSGKDIRYEKFRNPLQRQMRLGDIILQSHTGYPLSDGLRSGKFDFTTLSLGGSGGPIAHAAVSGPSGRAVDPGVMGKRTFKDYLVSLFVDPSKIGRDTIQDLRKLRSLAPRDVADSKFLARGLTDPFESDVGRPNASVVLRPQNLSGVKDEKILSRLADIKSVGYSRSDAALAGLRRILLPSRPWHWERKAPNIGLGTFCSHGACTIQGLKGLKTPNPFQALPPDLLSVKGQDLLGIGVNQEALKSVARAGLHGKNRLAEAARRTMLDTLKHAANTRRIFAGALIAATAGAGALGGKAYSQLSSDTKLIDKNSILDKFREMSRQR
jgi:hypothetical protein